MMKACLFLFALFALATQAQLTNKFIIDDFSNGINQSAGLVLSSRNDEGDPPVISTSGEEFGSGCSGLVGCGRDMEMRVFLGLDGRAFDSSILTSSFAEFPGEWVIANPKTSTSIASIEYDGRDAEYDGAPNGDDLGGVDITAGGTGTTFRISAISDLDTSYDLIMVDNDGDICEFVVDVPEIVGDYDLDDTFFDFDLDRIEDDCDLENIDYILVSIASEDAVDAIVRTLAIVGPPNPSASPSRSRNPTASPSRSRDPTASPTPSNSPPPSPSPTPTVSPSERAPCVCECPLFHCGLIFDVPRDDDDNVDDDNNDDDDLVFVPVFAAPFDDDFEHVYPDDDENEALSLRGGLTVDHADDDDSNSGAVALAASAVIALALF